jgi:hypothetical protein
MEAPPTLRLRTLCILCFPFALFGDQVILANGDTLTGTIVKKDGDKLTLKSEFLGSVTMPWSAVRSLRSDAPLTVVLPGGSTVQGKVETSGTEVQVATVTGSQTAPIGGITALRNADQQRTYERQEHPGLFDFWTSNFDTSLALARGNAHTSTFTTAVTASRVTCTSKFVTYFNQIYGTARIDNVSSTTANAVRGGWSFNRNLDSRFFAGAFNDYERDHFQDLNLRFVFGGTAGYTAVKRGDNVRLDLLGGVDYERESFFSNLGRNSAEFNAGDLLLYKLSGLTSLSQSFRMFSNLSRTGDYRVNFDLGSVTTLRKWLGWQVTASDRFLSDPVFGRQRNDLLLSTGFRVTFTNQ